MSVNDSLGNVNIHLQSLSTPLKNVGENDVMMQMSACVSSWEDVSRRGNDDHIMKLMGACVFADSDAALA